MTLGVTSLTGYTAANINGTSGGDARARKFTASTSESIGRLEFYFDSTYDGDAIVKLFIANSSGTILGITGAVTAPVSGGTAWCGGSITPVSVTSGQDYYLGMYISASSCNSSGRAGVYRAGGSPTDSYLDSTSGTYTSPPSALSSLSNTSAYSSIAIRGLASTATLSTPTPSGTLGTTTTATIGATTNQNTGTLYYVASTDSSKILTATGPQVVAGQGADGVALARNGSNTISTTTPTIPATGFSSGTTYYFAVAQSNANGVSTPVTGSFTTAVAYRSFTITLRDASGVLLNGVTLKFWTRTTKDGAAVDGGSTGLSITCGSNGVFSSNTLTIPVATNTYYLFWEDPSDPYKSHWKIHDFT